MEKKLILSRIIIETDMQKLSDCDMVIESIDEDLEQKKLIFQQLDAICPSPVILASNTSTLSLTEIAAAASKPERVIGMHFLYPVSRIHLVEIIRRLKTLSVMIFITDRWSSPTVSVWIPCWLRTVE